jgi:hypothetical protein
MVGEGKVGIGTERQSNKASKHQSISAVECKTEHTYPTQNITVYSPLRKGAKGVVMSSSCHSGLSGIFLSFAFFLAFALAPFPLNKGGAGVVNAFAGTIDLPRTGQTKCYNATGAEISCAGTGQDGEIRAGVPWPDPRFTDNSDGTVNDNLTGLVWTKDAGTPKFVGTTSTCWDGGKDWQGALNYVKCLNTNNYLGHDDWRLPNINELPSLVDKTKFNPPLPNGHPFTNVYVGDYDAYWLSSNFAGIHKDYAWYIVMQGGGAWYDVKGRDGFYVWPVRGNSILPKTGQTKCYNASGAEITCAGTGQDGDIQAGVAWPDPRFTDQGDGTVTDDLTGLIWTKDAGTPDLIGTTSTCIGGTKTWQGALNYVKCLDTNNYLGHNDWRLPNINELGSLLDNSNYFPVLPTVHPFTNVRTDHYWSSTYGYMVMFYDVDYSGSIYVWPVRGGQVGNLNYLAIFKPGTGSGTVTSDPSGINCGSNCFASYENVTLVTLTATPAADSVFSGWSGGGCSGKGTCMVTVSGEVTVAADFSKQQNLAVIKSGSGNGKVTADPSGLNCGATCSYKYLLNDQITLTATPDATSAISNRDGCDSVDNNQCTLTMNADRIVTVYFITKTATDLSLELSSQTILQNGLLDVSGKLTLMPATGLDLSGLNIVLTITAPDNSFVKKTTKTYDQLGHYVLKGISGFTQKGIYNIKASFAGTQTLAKSASDAQGVLVGSSAGYAIIVEGKLSDNSGLDSHNKTANRIYERLKGRGFIDDNIFYFNYDTTQPGVDKLPSKADIQKAISGANIYNLSNERFNLKEKMNGSPAPLYIIMVDHGNPNTFYINNETITPADLGLWLTTLEGSLTAAALSERKTIIIGACYSGSFIPALSKAGRVIITSAASDEESYKGPNEPDGIRSGEFFLEELFKDFKKGYSIRESFGDAAGKTEVFTRKGGSVNSDNKYYDNSMQHPLIDDNGDGTGSNLLSEEGDGLASADLYVGVGLTYDANSPDNPADITKVTDTKYLSASATSTLLWAKANNDSDVSSSWIEVRPPSKTLSSTGGSNQLEVNIPKKLMTFKSAAGRWETTYPSFTESGLYEVFYYVRDVITGDISPMHRSVVYKNKAGNTPPEAFSLLSPADGSEQKTVLLLNWDPSTDPDGLTYTLLISRNPDPSTTNADYIREEMPLSMAAIGPEAGLKDLTTYYWKVLAVDSYGARTSSNVRSFKTNNPNPELPGFIEGMITDETSGALVVSPKIVTSSGISKVKGSNYMVFGQPGEVTLTASAAGYAQSTVTTNILSGETWRLNITLHDNIAPQTAITSGPANPTANKTATFRFTSTETGSTFKCKLDSQAYAACTSPKSYTGLAAGVHTFRVKATDLTGNADATAAIYTWTIGP